MIRELYISKVNEVALNVTQTRIDSIRKKSIIKSGCRVYKDGYIGVAGTLGEATEDTWKQAEKNLENKVPYNVEPCKNNKRVEDLRSSNITSEEFLDKAEKFLDIVRSEFPDFILSNKIKSIEYTEILKNNTGLEYKSIDRYFEVELVVKDKSSVNVFDTAICRRDREFNIGVLLKEIRSFLSIYNNKLDLPKVSKMPVIMAFDNFGSKIKEALDANDIKKGTSIFSDKIGKAVFSKDFTLYIDRSEENLILPFFDAEGSVIENDKFTLIDNGIIKYGYCDKKYSKEYKIPNTAAATASYDEVPSSNNSFMNDPRMNVKSGNKTLLDIIGKNEAIYAIFMEGGDCTNEGDFASPVQMAYLIRDGKPVGRLPEFSVYGNIYNMFGNNYLGQSCDKAYCGDYAMVINMNIK